MIFKKSVFKSLNAYYFWSNQTYTQREDNNVLETNVKVALLNWNFEIQRSGRVKKEFRSNRMDNMKAKRTQVVLEYKRLESSEDSEQCLESFRIEGAIEVRYFEILKI